MAGQAWDAGSFIVDKPTTISHAFVLKNRGKTPVVIRKLSKSCGCTDVAVSSMVIPPAGAVTLAMSVTISPSFSDRTLTCAVTTDCPSLAGPLVYKLHYTSFPRVEFRPRAITYGKIHSAESWKSTESLEEPVWLDVYHSASEAPDAPAQFSAPTDLSVRREGRPRDDQVGSGIIRTSYPLFVDLNHGASPVTGHGWHLIHLEARTSRGKHVSLPVSWIQEPAVQAVPSRLHFPSVHAGEPVKAKLAISSADGRSFRLKGITTNDNSIEISDIAPELDEKAQRRPRHQLEFTLRLSPEGHSEFIAGTLTVETDDADCPKVSVTWSAHLNRRLANSRIP